MINAKVGSDPKNRVAFAEVHIDGFVGDVESDQEEWILDTEVGSSRCMTEDEYDPVLGEKLALGRALVALGRRLEKEAFKVVHDRDKARQARLEASQAALERRREATYNFLCGYAELINLKITEESIEDSFGTDVSVTIKPIQSTGSVLRDAVQNKKNKKKDSVRENLPA